MMQDYIKNSDISIKFYAHVIHKMNKKSSRKEKAYLKAPTTENKVLHKKYTKYHLRNIFKNFQHLQFKHFSYVTDTGTSNPHCKTLKYKVTSIRPNHD